MRGGERKGNRCRDGEQNKEKVEQLHPLRRRNHQAPSTRPPAQPPWLRVSHDMRFWGDS